MNVPTDRGEPERAGWLGTGPVPDTAARKPSAARGRSEEGWEGLCAQPPRGPCFLHYSPVGVHRPGPAGVTPPGKAPGPDPGLRTAEQMTNTDRTQVPTLASLLTGCVPVDKDGPFKPSFLNL